MTDGGSSPRGSFAQDRQHPAPQASPVLETARAVQRPGEFEPLSACSPLTVPRGRVRRARCEGVGVLMAWPAFALGSCRIVLHCG